MPTVQVPSGVDTVTQVEAGYVMASAYGAVGDGTTDDTSALETACATGKDVKLTDGKTYKVANFDITTSNFKLYCDTPNGAKIIAAGSATYGDGNGSDMIRIGTSTFPTTWKSLTADATFGTNTVQVADADDIASAGDYIMVRSEKTLPSPANGDKQGQFYKVISKSSAGGNTTYTLDGRLIEEYLTADTAAIALATVVENVTIENIQFGDGTTAGGGKRALQAFWTKNLVVRNCSTNVIGDSAFNMRHSVDWRIENCHFYRGPGGTAHTGTYAGETANGYGIAYAGAGRGGRITNCTFRFVRHAETDVENSDNYGAQYDVVVQGCLAENCKDYGFDTHEYVQSKTYIGCTAIANGISASDASGGLQVRNRMTRVIGCSFLNNWANAILVNHADARVYVEGCYFEGNNLSNRGAASSGAVIDLKGACYNSHFKNNYARGINVDGEAIIKGNIFEGCNTETATTGNIIVADGATTETVVVDSNRFIFLTGKTFCGVRPKATWSITNNTFEGAWTAGNEIRENGSTYLGWQAAGNRMGTAALQGEATLVGGTITVTNASVRNSNGVKSRIGLYCVTAGGTQGHVRVSTITNGTSFVLTSSSGTDTSTYRWYIDN